MSNINRIFIPKKGQSLKNGSVPSLGFMPTISIADWMSSVLASPILHPCLALHHFLLSFPHIHALVLIFLLSA